MKTPNDYLTDELEKKLLKQPSQFMRWFIHILLLIVVAFFVWAVFFKIDISVRGVGKTFNTGQIHKVQNLKGGVVKQILVEQGGIVDKGEVLLRYARIVEPDKADEKKLEIFNLQTQSTRLNAQINGKQPQWVTTKNKARQKIIANEIKLYKESQTSLEFLVAGIKQKIKGQQARINEITTRRNGQISQLKLVKDYYEKIKTLYSEGIANDLELNLAKRDYIKVKTEVTALAKSINAINSVIKQLKTQIAQHKQRFLSDLRLKKYDIDIRLNNTKRQLAKIQDNLRIRKILSPSDGIIKQLKVSKVGEMLKAGSVVAEIIPVNNIIELEVYIKPQYISRIKTGQSAVVRLTEFDFAIYGTVKGKVKKILSAKTKTRTGQTYYPVIIELESNYIQGSNTEPMLILAGMGADVNIITAHSSVMEYLLQPLKRNLHIPFLNN